MKELTIKFRNTMLTFQVFWKIIKNKLHLQVMATEPHHQIALAEKMRFPPFDYRYNHSLPVDYHKRVEDRFRRLP